MKLAGRQRDFLDYCLKWKDTGWLNTYHSFPLGLNFLILTQGLQWDKHKICGSSLSKWFKKDFFFVICYYLSKLAIHLHLLNKLWAFTWALCGVWGPFWARFPSEVAASQSSPGSFWGKNQCPPLRCWTGTEKSALPGSFPDKSKAKPQIWNSGEKISPNCADFLCLQQTSSTFYSQNYTKWFA